MDEDIAWRQMRCLSVRVGDTDYSYSFGRHDDNNTDNGSNNRDVANTSSFAFRSHWSMVFSNKAVTTDSPARGFL